MTIASILESLRWHGYRLRVFYGASGNRVKVSIVNLDNHRIGPSGFSPESVLFSQVCEQGQEKEIARNILLSMLTELDK